MRGGETCRWDSTNFWAETVKNALSIHIRNSSYGLNWLIYFEIEIHMYAEVVMVESLHPTNEYTSIVSHSCTGPDSTFKKLRIPYFLHKTEDLSNRTSIIHCKNLLLDIFECIWTNRNNRLRSNHVKRYSSTSNSCFQLRIKNNWRSWRGSIGLKKISYCELDHLEWRIGELF